MKMEKFSLIQDVLSIHDSRSFFAFIGFFLALYLIGKFILTVSHFFWGIFVLAVAVYFILKLSQIENTLETLQNETRDALSFWKKWTKN